MCHYGYQDSYKFIFSASHDALDLHKSSCSCIANGSYMQVFGFSQFLSLIILHLHNHREQFIMSNSPSIALSGMGEAIVNNNESTLL